MTGKTGNLEPWPQGGNRELPPRETETDALHRLSTKLLRTVEIRSTLSPRSGAGKEEQMMKPVSLLVMVIFIASACYNTYYVSMDQFKQLQSSESATAIVDTLEGKKVEVTRSTRLFVRDLEGKKYPVTPFNFKITGSQLVAWDRDYIFMLDQLKQNGEISLLSTPKTIALISVGALSVAGLIAVTVMTAGQKSFAKK